MISFRKVVAGLSIALVALLALQAPSAQAQNRNTKIWEAANTVRGVALTSTYKESPENGQVEQELQVELNNAPANITVQITINGQPIGSMTTDGNGHAVFDMRRVVQAGADGRPLGAKINEGDTVKVARGNQAISAVYHRTQ